MKKAFTIGEAVFVLGTLAALSAGIGYLLAHMH